MCVAATNADPTSRRLPKPLLSATLTGSLSNSSLITTWHRRRCNRFILWDKDFGTRTLHMMFWRFLPRFVTHPKKFKLSTINAKSEILLCNQMWQDSFLKRRYIFTVSS